MKRFVPVVCAALILSGCASGGGGPKKPVIDLSVVPLAAETYEDEDLAHLQFVLEDDEQLEYLEMSPEERSSWMRIVWASIDPTPTTEENERHDEHYRRLAFAREHFAIDGEPGWDRRGELLLRYGVPDQRQQDPADVVDGFGLVPPREVWVYAWLGQAYRLEDQRMQGDFQDFFELERDNAGPSSPRNIEDARDDLLAAQDLERHRRSEYQEIDAEAELEQQRLQSMMNRGQEAYKERPQAYLHDHGGKKLDYVFNVLSFAGRDPSRTRVEINTAFWANELQYMPEGDGYVAVLDVEAVAKTPGYEEVSRRSQITRDPKDAIDDLQGRLVLDQLTLDLEPGEYRLALSVRDSLSRNVGIYRTETVVEGFPSGEMRLSDVQLALDVKSGQPGDPFLKGPYQVVPYPVGTFPGDRDIYLYFEIYGLEASPTGDTLYTVEFLIKPRTQSTSSWFGSSKGRVVPGVATSFDGAAKAGIVREYIVLDPSTFTADVYDVEITVTDRVSDREAGRAIAFAVQN